MKCACKKLNKHLKVNTPVLIKFYMDIGRQPCIPMKEKKGPCTVSFNWNKQMLTWTEVAFRLAKCAE